MQLNEWMEYVQEQQNDGWRAFKLILDSSRVSNINNMSPSLLIRSEVYGIISMAVSPADVVDWGATQPLSK